MSEPLMVIDGRRWATPLTALPLKQVGDARLTRKNYRGVYVMEGTGGFEFYHARGWLPVTCLQRRHGRAWKTWMVDDPLHWLAMREAVEDLPSGKVLIAGLGLGLMLHHIAQDTRFTAITVVEQSADVVQLIRPTLPSDSRVSIITGDFYEHIENAGYEAGAIDGVLWDLAVGTPSETRLDMLRGRVLCETFVPGARLVQFGYRKRRKEAS